MNLAKKDAAKTFIVGPILDTNGAAKTDEVVASIKVTKNGTVGAVDAQDTLTHDHTGHYKFYSDGGDFSDIGEVEFSLNSGTNAMAPVKFQVIPADLYDTWMVAQPTAAIKKFFDVASPVLTCQSVNQAQDNATTAEIKTALETGMTFATLAVTGAVTVGDGIAITCSTASKSAIKATGGATAGKGVEIIGTGTGTAITATGAVALSSTLTVTGATVFTGNVSAAAGITITQSTLNENAVSITGNGSGNGLHSKGGATGDGVHVEGGVTSGDGIHAIAVGNAHGMLVVGSGTGEGLHCTGGNSAAGDGAVFESGGNASAAGVRITGGSGGKGINLDTATVSGAVALGSTLAITGAVTAPSITMSGALQAATIVSTGTTTLNALTVTNNALVSGTTTHTGAVTLTGGIAAGAISGTLANDFITAASLKADAVTKIIDDFETQSQADPTGFHVNVKEINGTAQTAGDVVAVVNLIEDINRNSIVITNETGAVSLKNDAGVEMLTGSVTTSATETTRTRLV